MRRLLALVATLALVAGFGSAHAVSDGHYSYERQHCTGDADNHETGTAEEGCYTAIISLIDGTGHEYLGAGIRQTAEGENANTMDFWVDEGQGTKHTWTVDSNGPGTPVDSAGTTADPSTGLHLYFGADDNLDVGEHDSSPQVSNGPSDGGGIQINIDPIAAQDWLAAVAALDGGFLLTHLLPAEGGTGFCADGVCLSLGTQRMVAFTGGSTFQRSVANYDGKQWDPDTCAGPSDQPEDCGGHPLSYWNDLEGTVFVEPGFQIYEDPDAQASPEGPYPIPALYIGSCGAIFGGADLALPSPPATNGAGQVVIGTAC